MNDTLNVKDLAINTVGATQLPGSARAFARVESADPKIHLRSNSALGSLSPTVIRIAHQPRTNKSDIQRSIVACDQKLVRLDTSSLPTGVESMFTIALQTNIPSGVSLAEWRASLATLLGALLESDGALANQVYAGEF